MSDPHKTPLLVVISGPSGVGKDAVIASLRVMHPDFFYAVTATTRPMRPGEVDGHDYIFLDAQRFDELVQQGEFFEHAKVYGRRYGVPKIGVRQALADSKDVIVKVDVQGASTIRSIAPGAMLVFLAAPTEEELVRRLTSRKTESHDEMALRIATARGEMEQAHWFDAVIVNETDAVEQTVAHIVEAMEARRAEAPGRTVAI